MGRIRDISRAHDAGMKYTTLVCAAFVAALGATTAAQAQEWQRHGGHRADRQAPVQQPSQPQHQWQGEHRWQGQPQWQGQRQWQAPAYSQQYSQNYSRPYSQHSYPQHYYAAPQHRAYAYNYAPRQYYAPRYYAGGYVPYAYRAHRYWVNDWRAYNLYAPPYGYQWVQTDTGDFLLMALATGIIANAILGGF